MAMRLAVAFATEAQLWVNLQAQHDLWVVSQKKPPNVKPLRQAIAGGRQCTRAEYAISHTRQKAK
jgi:plasmid maintenance system antidote protein VapI